MRQRDLHVMSHRAARKCDPHAVGDLERRQS
jgi:hypothetical protein